MAGSPTRASASDVRVPRLSDPTKESCISLSASDAIGAAGLLLSASSFAWIYFRRGRLVFWGEHWSDAPPAKPLLPSYTVTSFSLRVTNRGSRPISLTDLQLRRFASKDAHLARTGRDEVWTLHRLLTSEGVCDLRRAPLHFRGGETKLLRCEFSGETGLVAGIATFDVVAKFGRRKPEDYLEYLTEVGTPVVTLQIKFPQMALAFEGSREFHPRLVRKA
jgi:hypothetical protein